MPIDASSDPYDAGIDPDDLALAGKGAVGAAGTAAAADKAIGAAADDDLESAGKGANPVDDGGAFEPEPVEKDFGKTFGDELVDDDPTGGSRSAEGVLDELDDDDPAGPFGGKLGGDDAFDDDDTDLDKDDLDLDL
jgi:hypothetical protein